ncbi:MAG: hypothetical protein AABY83_15405 [Pseudomonadota bacterium]
MTTSHNVNAHMGYAYDSLSAALVVDAPLVQGQTVDLREYFRQHREMGIEPAAVGILFHGAVHFWQVFASGHIANLVAVEWERLVQYEKTGNMTPPHAALQAFYTEETPFGAFTAAQLQETWVRFWETWVHLDDIDAHCHAMCEGPDAVIYAKPYLWLLEVLDGHTGFAAWLFPALCFNAFNTTQPVEVFCRAAQRAAQSQALRKLTKTADFAAVQEGWIRHWNTLVNESVVPILVERGNTQGSHGVELIQNGPLRSHPIYAEYLEFVASLQHTWRQPANPSDEAQAVAGELAALKAQNSDMWLAFAIPGHPWCRAVLNYFLPPPLVHSRDGDIASRRPANLRLRESRAGVARINETFHQHVLAVEQRVLRFRAASRAYALGLPLDAFSM